MIDTEEVCEGGKWESLDRKWCEINKIYLEISFKPNPVQVKRD
jgi:hypothetical protein